MKTIKSTISLLLLVAVMPITSCSSSDDEPTAASVKLNRTDYTLSPSSSTHIDGENVESLKWSSDNEFVATVDKGYINAGRVGEATLTATTSRGSDFTINVRVPGKFTLPVPDPFVPIGSSRSDIIKKMGAPDKETAIDAAIVLQYFPESDAMITYFVNESKDRLDGFDVRYTNVNVLWEKFDKFVGYYKERGFVILESQSKKNAIVSIGVEYGSIKNPSGYAVNISANEDNQSYPLLVTYTQEH